MESIIHGMGRDAVPCVQLVRTALFHCRPTVCVFCFANTFAAKDELDEFWAGKKLTLLPL